MKLDSERIAMLASNVRNAWNTASPDQINRGRVWYRVAHDLAEIVGNGDVRKGAGIIAALSPRMPWDRNVKLATDAGQGNVHGAMSASLAKVQAILDGADPATVLPMTAKTGHFFTNISDPDNGDAITVDVWAHRIATGNCKSAGPRNVRDYAECAEAYRIVAHEMSELGHVVQAGTWNWAREGGMC
jgi:hypothetical protein